MSRERVFMEILKYPVRLWMKVVFRPKLLRDELRGNNKPVLIIGNHVTFEDPILAMMYTRRPISYLAASINMESKFKKFIFRAFKIIPFTKGQMDIKALRQLKKYAGKKTVGLYPEGGRTWDGNNIDIIESISSLVKLLGIDVFSVNLNGFYFIKPRWAKKYRHGKTTLEVYKVLSKEEIKKMKQGEILDVIKEAVRYNEYDKQRESPVEYKGKDLAESIEKVLFKCPECGEVDCITSKGDFFWCTACNKKYSFDNYGFIKDCEQFDNPHDWNVWQSTYLEEIIETKLPLTNEKVRVSTTGADGNTSKLMDVTFCKDCIKLGKETIMAKDISSPNLVFTNVLEFFLSDKKIRLKLDPKKHSSLIMLEKIMKNLVATSSLS